MSTQLANYCPEKSDMQTFLEVARHAAISGLYAGIGNEQKILMILLAARELNLPPFQALNGGIYIVKGRVEISARLMNSMIHQRGHKVEVVELSDTKCVLKGTRKDNGASQTAQFSIDDAKRAGLLNKDNWKSYAEDMYFARAMSRLSRRLFPDIIGTAYVEGEIRDTKSNKPEVLPLEEASLEMIPTPEHTPEEIEAKMLDFLTWYPEQNPDHIREYMSKYASHWKKTTIQALADYSDQAKFMKDFTKWVNQHERKN